MVNDGWFSGFLLDVGQMMVNACSQSIWPLRESNMVESWNSWDIVTAKPQQETYHLSLRIIVSMPPIIGDIRDGL